MTDINLNRIEQRYVIQDIDALHAVLESLHFEQTVFSDRPISLTYFCDTPDFLMPTDSRAKIRTYTAAIPEHIDMNAQYKLNFKTYVSPTKTEKVISEGSFSPLLEEAKQKMGLPLVPLMAMSYRRSHYVVSGNTDIRVTVDKDISFHRVDDGNLTRFYHYPEETRLLEIKYNPASEDAVASVNAIVSPLGGTEAGSKKIAMYDMYKSL